MNEPRALPWLSLTASTDGASFAIMKKNAKRSKSNDEKRKREIRVTRRMGEQEREKDM